MHKIPLFTLIPVLLILSVNNALALLFFESAPVYTSKDNQNLNDERSTTSEEPMSLESPVFKISPNDDSENNFNSDDNSTSDEDVEVEEDDFLFVLNEAYTQHKNELQIKVGYSFTSAREVERSFEWEDRKRTIAKERKRSSTSQYFLEIEYGITDRLQIEMETAYVSVREHSFDEGGNQYSAFDDLELGVAYGILKETGLIPAITLGVQLRLPTGSRGDEIGEDRVGYGTSLAVSKDFGHWVGYACFGYEYTANSKIKFADHKFGPKLDTSGVEYGLGAALKLTDEWHIHLECLGQSEQQLELDKRSWQSEIVLVPGVRYGVENKKLGRWQVGVGFPIGLTNNSPDWGVIFQIQWEGDL